MDEFEGTLIEIAWKKLDSENNRFRDIDTKAIAIITITGVLITLIPKYDNMGGFQKILLILTAVSFFTTIFLCILVLRTRKSEVISIKYLIEDFKNENKENQIRGLISTIAESERSLCKVCNNKANELNYAVIEFGISVILLVLYSLLVFL